MARITGNGNGSNLGESPKNGKGSEIYGTIRNAAPPAAVAASAHARDRALHHSEPIDSSSPVTTEQRNSLSVVPQQVAGDMLQGEAGMDDMILDGVIIPAIESVSHG